MELHDFRAECSDIVVIWNPIDSSAKLILFITVMSTPELSPTDLQDILKFTVTLARKAGEVILEGSRAIQSAPAKDINEKKNSVDLVTEFDVKVEELVKKDLGEKYPTFDLWIWLPGRVGYLTNCDAA